MMQHMDEPSLRELAASASRHFQGASCAASHIQWFLLNDTVMRPSRTNASTSSKPFLNMLAGKIHVLATPLITVRSGARRCLLMEYLVTLPFLKMVLLSTR